MSSDIKISQHQGNLFSLLRPGVSVEACQIVCEHLIDGANLKVNEIDIFANMVDTEVSNCINCRRHLLGLRETCEGLECSPGVVCNFLEAFWFQVFLISLTFLG